MFHSDHGRENWAENLPQILPKAWYDPQNQGPLFAVEDPNISETEESMNESKQCEDTLLTVSFDYKFFMSMLQLVTQ